MEPNSTGRTNVLPRAASAMILVFPAIEWPYTMTDDCNAIACLTWDASCNKHECVTPLMILLVVVDCCGSTDVSLVVFSLTNLAGSSDPVQTCNANDAHHISQSIGVLNVDMTFFSLEWKDTPCLATAEQTKIEAVLSCTAVTINVATFDAKEKPPAVNTTCTTSQGLGKNRPTRRNVVSSIDDIKCWLHA